MPLKKNEEKRSRPDYKHIFFSLFFSQETVESVVNYFLLASGAVSHCVVCTAVNWSCQTVDQTFHFLGKKKCHEIWPKCQKIRHVFHSDGLHNSGSRCVVPAASTAVLRDVQ